jgi:hypothetical protein
MKDPLNILPLLNWLIGRKILFFPSMDAVLLLLGKISSGVEFIFRFLLQIPYEDSDKINECPCTSNR